MNATRVTPRIFVSVTVNIVVSLGTKLAQAEERVLDCTLDLTRLHSCTLASLLTELLSALDHSSNAFALALKSCHKTEFHLTW